VQTAEGALTEVHSMLNRIRDLIVQSANTASSDAAARQAAQNEIEALRNEIDRIAQTTTFGSQVLLDGSFGSQAARLSTTVVSATGQNVHSTSVTFDLVIDSGATTSASVTVALGTGTYATAASWEAELQSAIDATISSGSVAGFTGSVTVQVRDLGGGAWTTELIRNRTDAHTKLTAVNIGTGVPGFVTAGSASVSNASGGVFQVGANVTSTNQIAVSVSDIRIASGTVGDFTSLANIDVTDTTTHGTSQVLIDDAISAVSTLRGQLGAAQNRFESTISNLQVTTENLAASESRIRDTDMALEMVTFTRHQIMLQAGTAMLAQANAAPQSVLRLLQ
jgi:flagellin